LRHRVVRAGLAGLLVLVVSACGEPAGGTPGDIEPASEPGEDAGTVDCGGSRYHPDGFADAPPLSSLPAGPAGAVDDLGEPAFDRSDDWRVVYHSEDRVDLVRELDTPIDHGEGDVRTHESRTVERITGAANVPDGTWMLMSAGPCVQRIVSDDLGVADLTFARIPAPEDTRLDLLVHERACVSGRSAEGRIELVHLDEIGEEVRLHIRVRPPDLEDEATCEGNPLTPFTVELAEPLGDRVVLDAAVVPARPLSLADREAPTTGHG
jgi:hypothetical protein